MLAFSGNVVIALVYVIVAGIAIGVWSPMVAIYAHGLAPLDRVATLMGTERMIGGLGSASGPGIVAEASGTRGPTILIACAGTLAAALILAIGSNQPGGEASPEPS